MCNKTYHQRESWEAEQRVSSPPSSPDMHQPPRFSPLIGGDGLSRYRTDFHEIEQIGCGNFSHVFKVLNRLDGCMYAVKQSIRELHHDVERRHALMEVQALASLGSHENIVGYHTSWFENHQLYIQMELCERSLSIDRDYIPNDAQVLEVLHQMAKALHFIHERGIAHLDVKPDNIYVKSNSYKLGDFGCATRIDRSLPIEEGDSRYMPQEMLNDQYEHLDKVDIFSLGAAIYELVKGSPLPDSGPQFSYIREGRLPLLPGHSMQFQALFKVCHLPVLEYVVGNNQIGLHLKKTEKSLCSPEENKVQHHADHKLLPSAVSTQSRSSQHFPKQNHPLEPASTFFHISNQQAEMEYIHPAHQVPCLQTPSVKFECESDPSAFYNVPDTVINYDPKCMESFANQMYKPPIVTEEKLGKRHRHQLSDTLMPDHQQKQSSFTGKVSTQKFHGYCQEIGADSRVQNASLVPALEVDSSVAQSGSFIASVPDDLSVEATSFQQLQDVIEQLDIRTRLCIRDSLYRLARSAKRRHDFTEQNMSVSKDARGVQCVEAQKKCSEFIDDSETVTNPIDRSIAHLLFTGLPEPTTGSI